MYFYTFIIVVLEGKGWPASRSGRFTPREESVQ